MDPHSLDQLESDLKTGSLDRCQKALNELAKISPDIAIPILERLSKNPEFLRRRFAIMGLGNHPTPESFAILQTLLNQEQDPNVLGEIANSLFEFGPPAVPLLQGLFHRCDHWLTRQSILAILVEANDDAVLLDVIKAALVDPTPSVQETGILSIGPLLKGPLKADGLALLVDLADSPDWRTRWRSATTLSICDDPIAKATLAKLRNDEHHRVVAAALEGGV
jgi:HEAT repeat protein